MPSCRRKHVLLTEPSQELLDAAKNGLNKEVYLLAQTGEIFDSYESVLRTFPLPVKRVSDALFRIQGLCRSHELLQAEAISVRRYWEERSRLFSGT